jgi:hypothetical protein
MAATPSDRGIRSSYKATSDYKYASGAAEDIFYSIAELEKLATNASEQEQKKISRRIQNMIKVLKDEGGGHTDDSIASDLPRYRK